MVWSISEAILKRFPLQYVSRTRESHGHLWPARLHSSYCQFGTLKSEVWPNCQLLRACGGPEGSRVEDRLQALQHLREVFSEGGHGQDADARAAARVDSPVDDFLAVFGGVPNVHGDAFFRAPDVRRHGRLNLWLAQVLPQHADLGLDKLLQAHAAERLLRGDHAAGELVFHGLLHAEAFLHFPFLRNGEEGPA